MRQVTEMAEGSSRVKLDRETSHFLFCLPRSHVRNCFWNLKEEHRTGENGPSSRICLACPPPFLTYCFWAGSQEASPPNHAEGRTFNICCTYISLIWCLFRHVCFRKLAICWPVFSVSRSETLIEPVNRSLVIAWPCHSLSDSLTNDLKSYVTLTDEDTRSKVVSFFGR